MWLSRRRRLRQRVAEQAKRENSAMVGQLKKNVLTVTMKTEEQTGTLTASLEQVQREIDA